MEPRKPVIGGKYCHFKNKMYQLLAVATKLPLTPGLSRNGVCRLISMDNTGSSQTSFGECKEDGESLIYFCAKA